jgi:hypothetical protein
LLSKHLKSLQLSQDSRNFHSIYMYIYVYIHTNIRVWKYVYIHKH